MQVCPPSRPFAILCACRCHVQMFDLDWLLEQYPQEYRSLPLMLVYGQDRSISSVCKPVYFCH